MIYDRTSKDAIEASNLIKNKVQKFIPITLEEQEILEKGTLTINTLNRIEQKQNEVAGKIMELGYSTFGIVKREEKWAENDLFTIIDFERILENLGVLKIAFFVYKSTPNIPKSQYHYKNINDIEKILFDLDKMILDVRNNFVECGTFQCGEVN